MALLDVVEWKNKPGEILYRFPEGAISMVAQLIVMENQEAVFFREGRALDSFGPGRHTLKAGNIPLLEKIVNLPFGGKSPFPAEVYYVNKTEIPNLKWGTKQPIDLLDPLYDIAVPIRAFGNFSIKVMDTPSFLTTAIGTWQAYASDTVEATLRDQVILPKLQDLIVEFMIRQNITILKLAQFYDEIGAAGKAKIVGDFESFGLELIRFAIESINVPQEDESVKRLKKALADKAEISIIGSDNYKMKRTFDTMEKAAGSEGMAGGAMGAGMGLSMGAQMGQMMGHMMQKDASGNLVVTCFYCNASNPAGAKFCAMCGKEIVAGISCPQCKSRIPANSKFCTECGANLEGFACARCGARLHASTKFCPECGAQQG